MVHHGRVQSIGAQFDFCEFGAEWDRQGDDRVLWVWAGGGNVDGLVVCGWVSWVEAGFVILVSRDFGIDGRAFFSQLCEIYRL